MRRFLMGNALAACCLVGCLLVTEFSPTQCVEDGDCQPIGSAPQRICSAGVCKEGCGTNQACSALGSSYMCPERGAECYSLLSPGRECYAAHTDTQVSAALTLNDMTLVGAFAPQVLDSLPERVLEFATEELNAGSGLPSPDGPRPLAVVLCRDDGESIQASMEHLLDGLHVRGLIASLEPRVLRQAFELYNRRSRALFVSPFNAYGEVEQSDLLWYLLGSVADVVPGYQSLLGRLLPPDDAAPRVAALVLEEGLADAQLAEAVLSEMAVEGQPLMSLSSERFARFGYFAEGVDRARTVSSLSSFAPHVVLVFVSLLEAASSQARISVLEDLEASWPTDAERPYYVLSPRNVVSPGLARLIERQPSLGRRVVGVNFSRPAEPGLSQRVLSRFAARFPSVTGAFPSSLYDAVYVLSYSLAAAEWTHGQGPELLVQALRSISAADAPRVEVGGGPNGVQRAYQLLRAGQPFSLLGLTGPVAFEGVQRTRPSGYSYYCLRVDAEGEANYLTELSLAGLEEQCGDFVGW